MANILINLLALITALAILFGIVASFAAVLYFGIPFVTGFDGLGFWQYFVGVIVVALLSYLVFIGNRRA